MLQAGSLPVQVPDDVDVFNLPNPSSGIMALRSTQPLTEMSTRNLPGGKNRWVSRMSENVGASTSRNSKGLHGLYRDNYIYIYFLIKMATGFVSERILSNLALLILKICLSVYMTLELILVCANNINNKKL
jgi:hypothetical protein